MGGAGVCRVDGAGDGVGGRRRVVLGAMRVLLAEDESTAACKLTQHPPAHEAPRRFLPGKVQTPLRGVSPFVGYKNSWRYEFLWVCVCVRA